ncbi:hypothetical protein MASR1M31_02200 [Porphyromonadaceae bacterium]
MEDRIIGDQKELNQVDEYIELNPTRWTFDKWYVDIIENRKEGQRWSDSICFLYPNGGLAWVYGG